MKLALELLLQENIRLQQEINRTGDATGIYSRRLEEVNNSIFEINSLLNK